MQRSDKQVAKFYGSKQWQKVRQAYKVYRHGLCERCGRPGQIVHHKEYITTGNISNPNVTISFDNLELVCQDCHNKEHIGSFTEDGQLKPRNESILELAGIPKK